MSACQSCARSMPKHQHTHTGNPIPTYHTQPSPTWRDRFTERELRVIANARNYAENDRAGLPGHNLLLIIAERGAGHAAAARGVAGY